MEGKSHAEVVGATFARNMAAREGRGGCVYERGNAVAIVRNSVIVGGEKQPDVKGGGFCLADNATLLVSSCTLSRLHAARGAGIYAIDTSSVHARDVRLYDTTAVDYGGGLFATTHGRITWFGGSFMRTHAHRSAGAIDAADGSIIVTGTRFEDCSAGDGGGCVFFEYKANASLTDCLMRGCTADGGGGGGAVYVTNTASVRLESCNITHSRSVQSGGGALGIFEKASVQMYNCRLEQNQAVTVGGAIVVQDNSQLTAANCMVLNNSCADRGGGLGLIHNVSAQLIQCLISGCSAGKGGGMSLEGQAVVNLDHTQITRNTAESYGGGVTLSSNGFDGVQMHAAVHNNEAPARPDVSVWPTSLTMQNSRVVFNYVSRLRVDEGVLHVGLLLTGPHGLPAAGVQVNAVLEGVVLHKASSGDDGLVRLPLKLIKPPGTPCAVVMTKR
jgi:hypothetical protein